MARSVGDVGSGGDGVRPAAAGLDCHVCVVTKSGQAGTRRPGLPLLGFGARSPTYDHTRRQGDRTQTPDPRGHLAWCLRRTNHPRWYGSVGFLGGHARRHLGTTDRKNGNSCHPQHCCGTWPGRCHLQQARCGGSHAASANSSAGYGSSTRRTRRVASRSSGGTRSPTSATASCAPSSSPAA